MSSLDYFLYDNRTWSPQWGRDWGLKAATGVLAGRADLKAAFDKYCGALPDGHGRLRGFGEAIGGVRPSPGGGYLLCVTLESADSFGRPSWTVFGLWCPDATLEQTLSAGDPIGSVRALLGMETPPGTIEIRPAKSAAGPRRKRRASAETAFYRFDPKSTVREVIALLLGTAQENIPLPNVLGITASSRPAAIAKAGFDVVYCHPMDDQAERALARVLSPQEPEDAERWTPLPARASAPSTERPTSRPEAGVAGRPAPRPAIASNWIFWLAMALMAAVSLVLVVGEIRRDPPSASEESAPPAEREASPSGGDRSPEKPEKRTIKAVLAEVGERLEECKELEPEELRNSRGFVVAETVEVLPKYRENRIQVQQAYLSLIEIRSRMVKRDKNYVAYYYDEDAGKKIEPAMQVKMIAEILGEAPLGGKDCTILHEAFGAEFEDRSSVLRQWCDVLGKLEQTASRSSLHPADQSRVTGTR